jgi:hypothetical protein
LNNPKNKKFPYLAVGIFTFNDFDIEWATEIIKLKYDYKQIFVVDDSTKDEYIKIVDEFCKKNQLQIIRGRNFFQKKFNYSLAAAKNNFILSLDKKFEYFIECGVGDYLPSDYVNVLMNRVINEPGIGLINGLCFGKFNNSMFHNIEAVQYCSLTYRNYFTNLYRDT